MKMHNQHTATPRGFLRFFRGVALVAASSLVSFSSASADVLLGYEVAGRGAASPAFLTPNTEAANTVGSDMTQGAGLTNVAAGNQFLARSYTTGNLASAISSNDYFTFSIAPTAGFALSFTDVVFDLRISGIESPTNFQMQYSFDNSSYLSVGSEIVKTATAASYPGTTISLNVGALQDVTSTVYFRLYGYNSANANGGSISAAGIINDATGEDFIVNGTVAAVPEPGSAGLVILAGLGFAVVLRRRSRSLPDIRG